MSAPLTVRDAMLLVEPDPPDEARPRALPHLPRLSIYVTRPPGCTAWRASVYVHLESGEPHHLEASFASSVDAWEAVKEFVERATGEVVR